MPERPLSGAPCSRFMLRVALALCAGTACGSRTELSVAPRDAEVAPEAEGAACGPATCSGCCDDAGACQPGTAQDACGLGGQECQACDPRFDVCNPQGGESLVVGVVCWAPCPLRECAGCCTLDGKCVAGDADDACGGPMRVCSDCASHAMVCGPAENGHACVGR